MQVLTCETAKAGTVLTPSDLERAAQAAHLREACVIVRRLDSPQGDVVYGDPDRWVYPASMLKTPLALAALTLVADGELSLDSRTRVDAANMTVNDKPSPLEPGYPAGLGELIDLAITRSDNVATNMLYDIVGRERAGRLLAQRYDLRATAFYRKVSGDYPLIVDPLWDGVHRNTHSARDAARVFELVARDAVPYAKLLRDTLARQEWNNKLSAGLHPEDRFAHKTGDTDEVTHDGGILDLPNGRSYVVVVYTAVPSSDESNAAFGPFMRHVRALL